MILSKNSETAPVTVTAIEGATVFGGELQVKPLVSGDEMLFLEIHYKAGVGAPMHVHSHESLTYVVSGRMKMTVGDEAFEVGPGDVCRHPEGVPHAVEALEDSVMIEVKAPVAELASFFRM